MVKSLFFFIAISFLFSFQTTGIAFGADEVVKATCPKVVVYSRKTCPGCKKLKEFFQRKNFTDFKEIDVDASKEDKDELEKHCKSIGVKPKKCNIPFTVIDDKVKIMGLTDLKPVKQAIADCAAAKEVVKNCSGDADCPPEVSDKSGQKVVEPEYSGGCSADESSTEGTCGDEAPVWGGTQTH